MTQAPYNNQYNQAPQGGYQQQQGGYQQQPPQGGYQQQQGGGQQRQNSGFDNYAQMTVMGRIVNDPTSKQVGGSSVASAKIAINHRSEKAGTDFWFIEAWAGENSQRLHNFLVNHCPKGRKVLVIGVPELRQTTKEVNGKTEYNYFPTIKIMDIIGAEGGNTDNNNNNNNNQQQQQQPQGGYQQQQQQQPPAPQQGYQQAPPAPQQGYSQQPQYNQAPPAPPQGGGFPPSVPGAPPAPPQQPNYGAPVGAGAPAGAPNGGFPPR